MEENNGLITQTYVKSINGYPGSRPFMPSGVALDGIDIRVQGSSGNTILQKIQQLARDVRPLYVEQIDETDDYLISLPNGITLPLNNE